ncbi:MAG: hypothetical protein TREMPRED_002825 [Tremellales sp. Tagirdzhanova-0007]|nr:MAG: hypothetical protein TREMPRED_002825 [Tremellales sp. Tagirdzhanova-0007]
MTFPDHRPELITHSYDPDPATGSGGGENAFLTYKPNHNSSHGQKHLATKLGIGKRIASPATNPFSWNQSADITGSKAEYPLNKQLSDREDGVRLGFETAKGSGLRLNHSWETIGSWPRTIDPRWVSPQSSLLTTPATSRRPSPAPPDPLGIGSMNPDWDANNPFTHLRQHHRPNPSEDERSDLTHPREPESQSRFPMSMPLCSAQGFTDFDSPFQMLDLGTLGQSDSSGMDTHAWSSEIGGESGMGGERLWGT